MDLVAGVQRVVVVMDHNSKAGEAKFLKACDLPLTGTRVVDLLITDLGVFDIDKKNSGVTLIELAPGVTVDEIRARTEANFEVTDNLA
jgi:3-oxoacid CoA-transferase B subunit